MPSDDSLILALAQRRGMIPPQGADATLDRLLRDGVISEETVSLLARELAAAPAELPPDSDRYEVQGVLGEGGMGRVVRAWDRTLARAVALKFLRRQDGRAFMREAQAQARVHHPHVCPVYEVGEAGGQPYIAMELVDGPTFTVAAAGMRLEEKIAVLADVADAAHAAHGQGLIHRDLKLGNVLIKTLDDGRRHPYVTDFGLAREAAAASTTVEPVGTPQFMAPEQARGGPVDRRADVYSLGAMLYTLLSGRPPFEGSVLEVLQRIETAEPRPLDRSVPRDLETIAMRCLAKRPEQRYGSARELADELRRWLRGEPIVARPIGWPARVLRRARRHRALVAVTVAALALAVYALVARAAAAREGRLGQQLGEEVARLDDAMRVAHLRPLHDLGPDRAEVARRMAAIERLADEHEGPGHYALGAGCLALRRYDEARAHLERAWRAGFRTPEAAAALGRTLGALYQRGLVQAAHLASPEDREQRRRDLGATLRDPAAAYLLGARAADPELVDGLLALYDRRFADAEAAGARAFTRNPALYEALVLQGDAAVALGRDRADANAYEDALAAYERGGARYRQAQEIGRSDPQPYEADCQRLAAVMEAGNALQRPRGDALERALAGCDAALVADPDSVEALAGKAAAINEAARGDVRAGNDVRPLVERSVAVAEAALRLRPDDEDVLALEGRALAVRVSYDAAMGGDLAGDVAAAVPVLDRLSALNPRLATGPLLLGRIHRDLGYALRQRGADPSAALARSIDGFERALALKESPEILSSLASVYSIRADHEYEHGLDWHPAVARSLELGRRATERAPHRPDGWTMQAMFALSPLQYAVEEREDPGEARELAVSSARRALALNPSYGLAHDALGSALALKAVDDARRGLDPRPAFTEALLELDAAIRDSRHHGAHTNKAHALRMMAQLLVERGADASAELTTARAELQGGRDDLENVLEAADIELVDADQAARRGRPPLDALARAAALVAKGHALSPAANLGLLADEARLHRLRASWLIGHGGRADDDVAAARRAIDAMLAMNPRRRSALDERERIEAIYGDGKKP